ncbi:pectinesterase-like [Vicia villosa]|uniref:pectinesterase-like n=1 Tax=Vicia villosa TaxID=3911 RepID=UPI00273A78CC|nr:pectinesterase-like [Vicia villosa]
MATQETLLDKPRKSLPKTFWLILSLAAIISSSTLIATHFKKPTTFFHLSSAPNLCEHALDTKSCLTHVSEVVHGPTLANTKDHKLSTLLSLLTKSTTHIQKSMKTANVIKSRVNSRREEIALNDCEQLMNLSMERVWDSVLTLTKDNMDTQQNAHTWLSSVLTNHVTCLDGLEGASRVIMENDLQDLISRARSSLAVLVSVLPSKGNDGFIDESLNGEFPSWLTRKDRRLLELSVKDIKANVVVAEDGSGDFKTVAEAVASAPKKGKTRYIIYVKNGTYEEHVDISSQKTNVMLVGDGMNATIITGSLNVVDGTGTFQSATVAAVGDGFIAQDIGFFNTAGPEKHQAVALRVGSDQSVINRCHIDAFQDTLYAHSNRQFYSECFITGTIDFIFGNAAVVIQKSKIVARKPLSNQANMVTAQGRLDPNQNTATSIQQCDIIPSTDLIPVLDSIKTYLGRPWKNYSRTAVMQSLIGNHIVPTGWAEWNDASKSFLETLYYGEYMNSGPGAGTSNRVNWTGYHVINDTVEATKFTVAQLIQGNVWLKDTGVAFIEGL